MPSLRHAVAASASVLLLAGATGCSSDEEIPTDPPRPMSARVVVDDADSKTYDMSICYSEDEQTLLALGTDQVSETLALGIEDGQGDITVVTNESLLLEGTATEFSIDESLEFEILGTGVAEDGTDVDVRVWGSCAEAEEE